MAAETDSGHCVNAGEGTTWWVVSDLVTIKATGEDTGGAYTLLETTVVPQAGPPPHVHTREDEWFYLLEGELKVWIGDQEFMARPGAFVHGPKGVQHTFKNIGDRPAKMLVIVAPAGIERFFAACGVPVTPAAPPPTQVLPEHIGRLLAAAPQYGIEIMPPAH